MSSKGPAIRGLYVANFLLLILCYKIHYNGIASKVCYNELYDIVNKLIDHRQHFSFKL